MTKAEKKNVDFNEDKNKVWRVFNSMQMEYKGHKILFDVGQRAFYAKIARSHEYREDLDELLKRIDAVVRRVAQVDDLQLLYARRNFRRVTEVRITQILPNGDVKAVELEPRGGLRSRPERHTWTKFDAERFLFFDTPRNKEIIEDLQELQNQRDHLDSQLSAKEDELAGLDIDDYLADNEEAAA